MGRPRKNAKMAPERDIPDMTQDFNDPQKIYAELMGKIERGEPFTPDDSYKLKRCGRFQLEAAAAAMMEGKIDPNKIDAELMRKAYYKWCDAEGHEKNSDSWAEYKDYILDGGKFLENGTSYDHLRIGHIVFEKLYGKTKRLVFDGLSPMGGFRVDSWLPLQQSEIIPGVAITHGWSNFMQLDHAVLILKYLEGATAEIWSGLLCPPSTNNPLTTIASLDHECKPPHLKQEIVSAFWDKDSKERIVPWKDLLDKRLQKLTLEDLLPIFPEAERKILKLWIGRAFLGGKDVLTAEAPVNKPNDWRYAVILSGDPQTGKSFFIEQIRNYALTLGLQTKAMDMSGGRFGGAVIARAHIAYNMDVVTDQLFNWSRSPDTNGLISGDVLPTEQKYQAQKDVAAHCAVIAACNVPTFGGKMPPGAADRLLVLQTLPKETLNQMGIKDLYHAWSKKLEEMNAEARRTGEQVTYNFSSLVAALVAMAVEEYAELGGMVKDIDEDGTLNSVTWRGNSQLIPVVNELRDKLIWKTTTNVPLKMSAATLRASSLTLLVAPLSTIPEEHHNFKYSNLGHLGKIMVALNMAKKKDMGLEPAQKAEFNRLCTDVQKWLYKDYANIHASVWRTLAEKAKLYDDMGYSPAKPSLSECLTNMVKSIAVTTGEAVPVATINWALPYTEEQYFARVEMYVGELKAMFKDDTQMELFKQCLWALDVSFPPTVV